MVEPRPALVQREATYDALVEAFYELVDARTSSLTLQEALKLPPVIRGTQLIASVAASMLPLAYRGNEALTVQPRIVRKPDPFSTRYQFVYQTVDSIVSSQYGEAFWLLTDHDDRGYARSATVLPPADVRVQWDDRRWLPRYFWRDRELIRDVDIKHIAPNRRPGELHGHGPIADALEYLYPVAQAEAYASSFFASGGIPTTVLKAMGDLTSQEAAALKTQWTTARTTPGEPAVIGGGISLEFPAVDPQRGQMAQARAAGASIVARILGIPAAMLHVETSGATITYTNPAGALEELVKSTILPGYLTPIEQAWSELVPPTQAVRFDLADLQRTDMAARFAIYKVGIDAGILSTEEARAYEGWAPSNTEPAHQYDPEPTEVPA